MTADLANRLAAELDSAFPELIDEYGSMVLTHATRLTDASTGQDITQEVFFRAYRALHSYTNQRIGSLSLRPWLATITRNLVRNEYRRRERKGTQPLEVEQHPAAPNGEMDLVESYDQMNTMLATLSDTHREAVVLRHVVGLPLREVALIMACPEGTAKSNVSRGLSQLRELLTSTDGLGSRGDSV